ncbi:MAG: hypothetical protein ACI81V_000016 [Lentimonas sp.]|jgi:hypothetical protein
MKQMLKLLPCCLVCVCANSIFAQTESAFQDDTRLLGAMDIVASVMEAGSDAASDSFQKNELADFNDYIRSNWSNPGALAGLGAIALDPNAIVLFNEANVRAYVVTSETSQSNGKRHNSLGFNTGDAVNLEEAQLIFPWVQTANKYYSDPLSLKKNPRKDSDPLIRGDFVDLGLVGAGEKLNFFIANGTDKIATTVFTADAASNPDQASHMVAFAIPDSPFILLGYEDPYSGNNGKFNDNIFAFNIGAQNVAYLANPEPSFWLMMGAVCGLGVWLYRRPEESGDSQDLVA